MQQKIETLEDLLKKPIIKCIVAGIIPAVLLLFIYIRFDVYPYDRITVMNSDLNGQYVSYLAYLKRLLEECGSFLYSFSKTLGGDFMPILTYYLLSPFNLVLLFVPFENIPYALFLIILLKTSACGITMFLFLSSKNEYRYYNLIFSTAYALSGYMIMFQTHIMWLDGVILLPLIALGIDRLIEKKKSALYIFALAASITICYYTGYMSCIFAVIYFLYRLILCGKEIKKGNRMVKFGLASVCAGGISAVILFPAVYALINTKFSAEAVSQYEPFGFSEFLAKFFTGAGDNMEFQYGIPFVFSGILSVMLLIQFFFTKSVSIKEKLLNGALVLCFVISFFNATLDKTWHGFAVPNNFNHRYSFIFIFCVLLIAWKSFSIIVERKEFSVFSAFATWIIIIGIAVWVILKQYSYISTTLVLLDVAFVSIGLIILFYYLKCDVDFSALLIVCFGMLQMINLYINGTELLKDRQYQDTSISGYIKEVEDSIAHIQKYDTDMYRIEQDFHYSNNDPMLFSYRGLSHFSSAESSSVIDFMGHIGFNQNFSFWAAYGNGGTLAGDSLLGLKYFLSRNEWHPFFEEFHYDATINTFYNPYSLSFGFMANDDILNPITWDINVFSNLDRIYAMMSGDAAALFHDISAERYICGMTYNEENGYWFSTEKQGNSYLSYQFKVENKNPVYVYLPTEGIGTATAFLNGEQIGTWLDPQNSELFYLGTFEEGKTIELILQPDDKAIGFSCILFAYLDMAVFEEKIEVLQDGSWYLYESTDTKIEAEVTAKEGEVLFLSIPYDKNWTLFVDGNETEIKEVLDVFMAVELSEGTHHIVLKYQNPTLILGLFVTILCTFAAIFIIISENKKMKRRIVSGELLRVS